MVVKKYIFNDQKDPKWSAVSAMLDFSRRLAFVVAWLLWILLVVKYIFKDQKEPSKAINIAKLT